MMLLSVPIGIGLLPCMATMTWRPSACRLFWWLPDCPARRNPALRKTLMTSFALQTGKRRLKAAKVPTVWLPYPALPAKVQTKAPAPHAHSPPLRLQYRQPWRTPAVRGKLPTNVWLRNQTGQAAVISYFEPNRTAHIWQAGLANQSGLRLTLPG